MKTQQVQHTPTPWVVRYEEDGDVRGIFTSERIDGDFVQIVETDSGFYGPKQADAAYIVRAVNAHEELVEAAKAMQAEIRRRVGFTATAWDQAIAKAEDPS